MSFSFSPRKKIAISFLMSSSTTFTDKHACTLSRQVIIKQISPHYPALEPLLKYKNTFVLIWIFHVLVKRKPEKKNQWTIFKTSFGVGSFIGRRRRRRKSLQVSLFYYRYSIFHLKTTVRKSSSSTSLASDKYRAFSWCRNQSDHKTATI